MSERQRRHGDAPGTRRTHSRAGLGGGFGRRQQHEPCPRWGYASFGGICRDRLGRRDVPNRRRPRQSERRKAHFSSIEHSELWSFVRRATGCQDSWNCGGRNPNTRGYCPQNPGEDTSNWPRTGPDFLLIRSVSVRSRPSQRRARPRIRSRPALSQCCHDIRPGAGIEVLGIFGTVTILSHVLGSCCARLHTWSWLSTRTGTVDPHPRRPTTTQSQTAPAVVSKTAKSSRQSAGAIVGWASAGI